MEILIYFLLAEMITSATFQCKITNEVTLNPRTHSSTVQAYVRVCVMLRNVLCITVLPLVF